MKSAANLITELSAYIPFAQKIDLSISTSSVGWHIDHSLLVINQIIGAVKASDPKAYKWGFNMKRLAVFSTGKIPRGKAKAPKSVFPENAFDEKEVLAKLEKTLLRLQELDQLTSNHFFTHPFFGNLNVKATKKMILLHTQHHLAIIKDIVAVS